MDVLIVDDNDRVRESLAILLETFDDVGRILEARNGDQAIQVYDENLPDVILMDLVMPRMNGVEAIAEIISRDPSAQIVTLSSTVEVDLIEDAFRAGAFAHLFKSAGVSELMTTLRKAYQRAHNGH